jgi:NAD(P)-dependent dehydrogenase (short-subunit alcohol dehydrogenase family)
MVQNPSSTTTTPAPAGASPAGGELAGRRVLLTGGSRGIGAAIVRRLTADGAQVLAVARNVPAESPAGVQFVTGEVRTEAGVQAIAGAALERLQWRKLGHRRYGRLLLVRSESGAKLHGTATSAASPGGSYGHPEPGRRERRLHAGGVPARGSAYGMPAWTMHRDVLALQAARLDGMIGVRGTRQRPYDAMCHGYADVRRPDPRIALPICAALGDASSVVNVGAGTGSYEPPEREVVAVEPSAVMIARAPVEQALGREASPGAECLRRPGCRPRPGSRPADGRRGQRPGR